MNKKISQLPEVTSPSPTDVVAIVTNSVTSKVQVDNLKQAVGLGNVDNTSDANKPVSATQQAAIDSSLATAKQYAMTIAAVMAAAL